jgi:hypothetical protein
MAKAPRIGQGKTRLAAGLGRVEAWRINRALQARALREARATGAELRLAVAPDRALKIALPGVWPRGGRVSQGGGDLGDRLARQARLAGRRWAVIGVDCPHADRRALAQAFALLRRAPAVIGPTTDGGFWILAARRPPPSAAFKGVRWSTAHACADMAAGLKRPLAFARRLTDVDTAEDWAAVQKARGPWRASSAR